MNDVKYSNIDEYIAIYDGEFALKLKEIRRIIKEAAPEAIEKISWAMPTFYLHGNLVHFAAMSKHIGFYPGADGVSNFMDRLGEYKTSKGAIQFPIDKPIPLELVKDIVLYRVKENIKNHNEKFK